MTLCRCGCLTEIQKITHGRRRKFVRGHNRRKLNYYKIDPQTDCWVWLLEKTERGYGVVTVRETRKRMFAHRFMYETVRGPIPTGMQLDHLCRNRLCVNPAHLEPVTNAENVRRGSGTKLTAEQVLTIRGLAKAGISGADMARMFNVKNSNSYAIVKRKSWADV